MLGRALVLSIAGLMALATACGGSEDDDGGGSSCATNPWSCGAGKTCWAATDVSDFQCLPAGTKQKGDSCMAVIGQAECGDAMMCLLLVPGAAGTCLPFCDLGGQHPCTQGETCGTVEMKGSATTVHLCVGGSTPSDGGSD